MLAYLTQTSIQAETPDTKTVLGQRFQHDGSVEAGAWLQWATILGF